MGAESEVTELLAAWRKGDSGALDKLAPIVHREIHRLAVAYMAKERRGHTLQPTALVNEAFLRLAGQPDKVDSESRSQFVGIAARQMRQVLVDHARSRAAAKRGSGAHAITLDDVHAAKGGDPIEVLALHQALERLAQRDPRKAKAVELRFFGGLEMEEIAGILQIHRKTVENDLRVAAAWLRSAAKGIEPAG